MFLSHSSRDRSFAEKLARVLRAHGIPVWYSGTDIVGAQQWLDEIGDALARCDWFIVVLSPSAVKSKWVKQELHYALRQTQYDETIVPVVRRKSDYEALSWMLENFQMVDFQQDFEGGCRELLRVWGVGYDAKK